MTVTRTGATRIASADAAESPILAVRGIRKAFGGVQALQDVSFEVLPGEIHALVGENGAGKSTLVKILSGAYKPDAGEIELSGQRVTSISPSAARPLGLAVIYQEFNLVPWMSVLDNVFLGREVRNRVGVLDRQAMRTQTVTLFEQLGVRIDPDARVAGLSVAQQQIVEIAKALATSAKVIIMDEPSAVLAGTEVATRALQRLRQPEGFGLPADCVDEGSAEAAPGLPVQPLVHTGWVVAHGDRERPLVGSRAHRFLVPTCARVVGE
jgi:ABC-type sugar transport system ATPase subunit